MSPKGPKIIIKSGFRTYMIKTIIINHLMYRFFRLFKVIDYDRFALSYGKFRDRIPALLALEILKLLSNKNKNVPSVICDIGANHGHFFLQSNSYNKYDQYLFEPNPGLIPSKCEYKRNWINIAVSDQNGEQNFLVSKYHSGGGKLTTDIGEEYVPVPTVRFDDFVSKNLYDRQISLIKIDTEGHEVNVLEGMQRTMQKFAPLLIIENNDGLNKLRDVLLKQYDIYALEINGLDYDVNILKRLYKILLQMIWPSIRLSRCIDFNMNCDNILLAPKSLLNGKVISLTV